MSYKIGVTYTLAGLSALAAKVWDSDLEVGLIGGAALLLLVGILGPGVEGLADGSVGGSVDDADVGPSLVGDAEVDLEVDNITGLVALDVGRVVGELDALAEVQVALLWVVALVGWHDTVQRLDVGGRVAVDALDKSLTASFLGGSSGDTRLRGGDITVAVGLGRERGNTEKSGNVHLGSKDSYVVDRM